MAMLAVLVLLASMAFPLLLQAQAIPDSVASHARAARAAEQRNDFPVAVREYQALAKLLPGNAEVLSNLGVAQFFNHELQPAITTFHKAIELNSSLEAPRLFSGLAWYQLSNPDAAVPDLEQAVRMAPKDSIAHTWLGYAYNEQGRSEDAVKQFEAASRISPNSVDIWYALGHTWLQIGKDATLKLLTAAPDGGRVWELAGEQSELRGDNKTALYDFEQAYARRPDLVELRDRIRAMGGTVSAASASSGTAAERQRADALYEKARNAERQSKAAFERVEQLAPGSYRAHEIMGDAFVSEKQDAKAIAEYRTVLQLKPNLPGIHEAIGKALVRSGKPAEALKEFEAEIALQPNSASAHMQAGRVLLMQGKDVEARKMLEAATRMDRPPLEAYEMLGNLDVRGRRYSSAVAELKRYLAVKKDDSTAYWLLAMAYRGLGEREQMRQAIAEYKKTSIDAQERSAAQRELRPATETAADSGVKLPAQ